MALCKKFLYLSVLFSIYKLSEGNSNYVSYYGRGKHSRHRHIDPINITVYYESLCPGSVDFFTTQLAPTVRQLSQYVNVEMIPYGFGKLSPERDGREVHECHHGNAECEGNKLQACVADSAAKNSDAVLFNACLMQEASATRFNYTQTYETCSSKLSMRPNIWDCMNNQRGDDLMMDNRNKTLDAYVSFVPNIIINGSSDKVHQARRHLAATLCDEMTAVRFWCFLHIKRARTV